MKSEIELQKELTSFLNEVIKLRNIAENYETKPFFYKSKLSFFNNCTHFIGSFSVAYSAMNYCIPSTNQSIEVFNYFGLSFGIAAISTLLNTMTSMYLSSTENRNKAIATELATNPDLTPSKLKALQFYLNPADFKFNNQEVSLLTKCIHNRRRNSLLPKYY